MINFSTISTTNLIGQVIGLPTTLCGINGRAAQTFIDWSLYGVSPATSFGVNVDMTGIAPSIQLDVIRSVYIDNLNNPNDVYVYFRDTKFTAPCARYTAAWVPVVTNLRQATIYGINFQNAPLLAVTFTNIFVPYAVQQLTAPGGVFPAQINYVGAQSINPASAQVFTFNAVPLGSGATQRRLLICASGAGLNAGASTTYGITNIEYDNGSGFSNTTLLGTTNPVAGRNQTANRIGIIRDDLSLNANIRVTVTSASPSGRGFITAMVSIFQLLGTNTNTPTTYVETQDTTAAQTLTLNVPENGCALFFATGGQITGGATALPPNLAQFSPAPIFAQTTQALGTGLNSTAIRNVGGVQNSEELGLGNICQFSASQTATVDMQYRACAFAPPA